MWPSDIILCSSKISVPLSLCFKKELCVMRYALCDPHVDTRIHPLFLNNLCLSVPLF